MDSLAPPPSAFSMRSNPLSPSLLSAPLSNASVGSGYSSMSNYSNLSAVPSGLSNSFDMLPRENTRTPVRTPHSPSVPNRIRTPVSGAPSRSRTPISAAPPREGARTPISARPRTPVSGAQGLGAAAGGGSRTPLSGVPRTPASGIPSPTGMPLSAPGPPSPSVRWERERERELERERTMNDREGEREEDREASEAMGESWSLDWERGGTLRSMRGRASPAPPPRSTNRPGSSAGLRPPPVAIPPREGMI